MHQVIVGNLEEYLDGTLLPAARRDFATHLEACEDCRREVAGMMEMSDLFRPLRPAEEPVEEMLPPLGFYARVMQRVGERQPVPSVWSWFSLEPGFGRRVVFASLLTLAVLGSYLVSRESEYAPGPTTPDSVMADQRSSDRDSMLVTLTTYEP